MSKGEEAPNVNRARAQFLFVAVLQLMLAPAVYCQNVSAIGGLITDPSGASVSSARIHLVEEASGLTYDLVTGTDGSFLFPLLPIGTYVVAVEAAGFRRYEQTGILLQVGERKTLRIELQVGQISESVTVQSQAPIVDTANATLGAVVDEKRMVDLPLNGRDPLQLMALVAGVTPTSSTAIKQAFTYAGTFVSSSGGRGNTVNFMLDGGDNNDSYTNVAQPYPNPDALAEFQFKTNSFSAEYGNATGGVVDAVIRSGTNQLHGTVFEFLRNFDLNATNFFSPGQADGLKRNQYGFTLGGPVVLPHYDGRDKTFFFASFQGTKVRQTPATSSSFSPTSAERVGDFSAISIPLKDPKTGMPFPGNQIPVSRFDPASVALLNLIPAPPPGQSLLFFVKAAKLDEFQWLGKLDQSFGEKERFFLSYVYDNQNNVPSIVGSDPLSATQGPSIVAQLVNLGLTSTLRPNLINVAHANFTRQDSPYRGVNSVDLPSLGVNEPNLTPGELGTVSVGGFFSVSNCCWPNHVVRNQYQFRDDMSWTRGKHEVRFGFESIRRQTNLFSYYLGGGSFSFAGNFSGSNLADFFLGSPSTYTLESPFSAEPRMTAWNFFIQDNFRVTRKLTLNLGLRWEPYWPWHDVYDKEVADFRPGMQSQRFPNAPLGLVFAGDPGVPWRGSNASPNDWAPRIGLAYDPMGNGNMAIRAAYGVFYEAPNSIIANRFEVSPPFVTNAAINPPYSFSNPFEGQPPFNSQQAGASNFVFRLPVLTTSYPPVFRIAYVQQWNFTVEHQLPANSLLRVAYAGSKGTHLMIDREGNAAVYAPGATVANTDQRRPYGPTFTSLEYIDSNGDSSYNSMQVTFEKRWGGSFSLLSNYTWQKSIDLQSNTVSPGGEKLFNPFNFAAARGPSDFDRTHRFVTSILYALPSLKDSPPLVRQTLGDWQVNGIVTLATGLPFSVLSGVDNSFSGNGSDHADLVLPNASLPGGRSEGPELNQWFNKAAFTTNAIGTFGNTGRNVLRGPGQANVDASLLKNFPLRERTFLQFRAEFFNLLNRANFSNPNATVTSPLFGRILSAADPRIIQLGLKLQW